MEMLIGAKDAAILKLLESGEFRLDMDRVLLKNGEPAPINKRVENGKVSSLRVGCGVEYYSLPRVVLIATVGLPNLGEPAVARFKDGNRENCHPDNLLWGTRSEAKKDSFDLRGAVRHHGGHPDPESMRGEKNPNSKLSDEAREDIIKSRLFTKPAVGVKVLAERYKVTVPATYAVTRRYLEQQNKENKNDDNSNSSNGGNHVAP